MPVTPPDSNATAAADGSPECAEGLTSRARSSMFTARARRRRRFRSTTTAQVSRMASGTTTISKTDCSPPVDGPCRLVHVVTGPDSLAGAEDLPGTSEVEGMDLAGMAMHRHGAAWLEPHRLGPAVRCDAQRAERVARRGRDPWHAVGVQRPGRVECQVARGSSLECGTPTLRPQWPTIQGQSALVLLGQWAAPRSVPIAALCAVRVAVHLPPRKRPGGSARGYQKLFTPLIIPRTAGQADGQAVRLYMPAPGVSARYCRWPSELLWPWLCGELRLGQGPRRRCWPGGTQSSGRRV
jgi:hypothetical protein